VSPMIVGRVGINRNGIKGYSEADLQGGPLRFAAAAGVLIELDADGDDSSGIRAQADYVVKVNGLSTTGGVYMQTAQDDVDFADQSADLLGFHLQAGYMVTPQHQLAGRFAMVLDQLDARDGAGDNMELSVGHSMYIAKHNLKLQTDFAVFAPGGGDLADDYQFRSQLQLAF